MSFTVNKSASSKLLTNKHSKSNLSSPKSVSTYIKEWKEEDILKQQKLNSPDSESDKDPTQLNNVLKALKVSSKGNIPALQPFEESDSENDICDFRNVGNLENISLPNENSFRDVYIEEFQECSEEEQISILDKSDKLSSRLAEEANDDVSDEENDSWNNLSLEILIGKIELEQQRRTECQVKNFQIKEAYLSKLLEIRSMFEQNLIQCRNQSQQVQIVEVKRLEQMNNVASQEATEVEKKYMEEVERRREILLKEVEEVSAEEAKRASLLQGLIDSLQQPLSTFRSNLISLQAEASGRIVPEGSELQKTELQKILFHELPSILEATEGTVSQMSPAHTTEAEIDATATRLTEAVKVLQDIQNLIHATQEQEAAASQETSQPESVTSQSNPASQDSFSFSQEPLLDVPPGNEGGIVPSPAPSPSTSSGEQVFQSLKELHRSVTREAQETRDNPQLRPLLSRAIGVVNTFHNERHDSSNRGKLQQLLNLLLGRPCTVGSDTVSTRNNPSAQAFVKEQLAGRLVILSHDKQVSSIAIYASLIVRLWQLVPQLGDLVLFKMYETCPFLVPLAFRKEPLQTEEEFHRSLGFRHKEGSPREPVDQYLTRMEAMAQLYGRIVSMQVDNHPHGIQQGWKWLATTLRNPPYPSVTPSLLHGFLTVAGAPLLGIYGHQFRKLMRVLSTSYLALIEEDVLEGGHSVVVALKNLLKEFEQQHRMPQVPEGYKLLL